MRLSDFIIWKFVGEVIARFGCCRSHFVLLFEV